jgi:predicted GH43/DUF377 family glycosyl hydrolase
MTYKAETGLFRRYEGNPILTPAMWPYRANAVFNPGATQFEDETLLLVRVEDMQGYSHLTIARSRDGFTDWRIDSEPALRPEPKHREELWGLEDPRIVWLHDLEQYAITYVSFSKSGPVVSLITTKDFSEFKRLGPVMAPEDKDASLFPRCFNGRFGLIHRPIVRGEADLWISFSPDLKFWGMHRMLLPVREGSWDSYKVGLGAQPIETPEGWLIIYHGVRMTSSGAIYRVGLALLDLEEPWKVIRRCREWAFGPNADYELMGNVNHVVFPAGAVVNEEKDELRMYYGAADSTVALATANLKEVLEYLRACGENESE